MKQISRPARKRMSQEVRAHPPVPALIAPVLVVRVLIRQVIARPLNRQVGPPVIRQSLQRRISQVSTCNIPATLGPVKRWTRAGVKAAKIC